MQVGLISDIHANLPALEAVLDDMPPVDDIICAGDIVGYNPWPRECLERVRTVSSLIVQGNHDRNVETPHRYEHNDMAHAELEFAQQELSDSQRKWLSDLPERTEFAGDTYRLVHSHPDPNRLSSYVRPAQFPKMRPYLDDHVGIVLGHTHIQHKATIDGRLIVNPGSVGQPRDGDERAAYATLDTAADEVELRRVEYDINRVISRVEECGLPTKTGTRLLDGS
ncbi:Predicted phosphodiesterase [Halorientalis persicus]|uniref:Predicted phosphodiesterase n=1 Tax=Halorientalis persicus TaxID=1367881 RepID=A0A1H8UI68_9EURY|nr:metallophosphoesterase family protein [Halorientalis persicus]SEP02932.1 Predicted phosphodiesterase [Halorientalis persicus]